jgi:hypothetical protein
MAFLKKTSNLLNNRLYRSTFDLYIQKCGEVSGLTSAYHLILQVYHLEVYHYSLPLLTQLEELECASVEFIITQESGVVRNNMVRGSAAQPQSTAQKRVILFQGSIFQILP